MVKQEGARCPFFVIHMKKFKFNLDLFLPKLGQIQIQLETTACDLARAKKNIAYKLLKFYNLDPENNRFLLKQIHDNLSNTNLNKTYTVVVT